MFKFLQRIKEFLAAKCIEDRMCPMCKTGTITYEVYGADEQFTEVLVPCECCGYTAHGLTESVLWPK